MTEIKALPSIEQVQEGSVEFKKLPNTYTLRPREVRFQISLSNTIPSYL